MWPDEMEPTGAGDPAEGAAASPDSAPGADASVNASAAAGANPGPTAPSSDAGFDPDDPSKGLEELIAEANASLERQNAGGASPLAGADLMSAAEGTPGAAQWNAMLAQSQARASQGGHAPQVQPLAFPQMHESGDKGAKGSIDLLLDVKLPVSVELGRAEMQIKEIVAFSPGTVVELNKMAGDMVDILVNGRVVAQGEVVVVDEHFGIRITHLLSPAERVRSLA